MHLESCSTVPTPIFSSILQLVTMPLLPRRIFQQCHALPAEPLLEEDYQKLSSPTASFTSMLEPEDESHPIAKTTELTDLLLRTSAALDHDDKSRREEEVAGELHIVLFRALHEATLDSYESFDVILALDSIEKLLRCSNHVARDIFFGGCGVPLLQLMFLLVEMNYRLGNPHIVSSCKSIIGRFVSLETDLALMYRSSEFLGFLVIAIEGTSGNEAVQCASLALESLSRLPVNKPILVNRRDILDCLFGMVNGNLPGTTRIVAMRSIVNLAIDFTPAVEIYANNQLYVSIIIEATLDGVDELRAAAVEILLLLLSTSSVEKEAPLLNFSEEENILGRLLLVAEDFTNADYTRVGALHVFVSLVKNGDVAKISADSILHLRNVVRGSSDILATQAAIAIKTISSAPALYDDPCLIVDAAKEMASSSCLQVKMWSARIIREQTLYPSNYCLVLDYRLMLSSEGLFPALHQLIRNSHPSVCRPALESVHSLVLNEVGAVAIAKDECFLSTLADIASNRLYVAGRQIAIKVLIALVMDACALDLIVSKRDIFVDILMELSSFGCGKVGTKDLRAEAMETVALLANHL